MKMLSQTRRINRSKHTGRPILEELNKVYGYWATSRLLTEAEYEAIMTHRPGYVGPMHPAEEEAIKNVSCG